MKYRKATHLYTISETLIAGLVLSGEQVKALNENKANFTAPYVSEGRLKGISFYDQEQEIQLLLHSKQFEFINQQIQQDGFTVIPLEIKRIGKYYKVIIAVAKGKKNYDKRRALLEDVVKKEI